MADISVRQAHRLPPASAKAAAQEMADRMAAEYDVTARWSGNCLTFERSGLSGTLVLHENEARLDIALGFLLKVFSSKIEEKAVQQMKKIFDANA
jgi:putative polyhydroxyalkanoate system protein